MTDEKNKGATDGMVLPKDGLRELALFAGAGRRHTMSKVEKTRAGGRWSEDWEYQTELLRIARKRAMKKRLAAICDLIFWSLVGLGSITLLILLLF
jgi:hypothetical protein